MPDLLAQLRATATPRPITELPLATVADMAPVDQFQVIAGLLEAWADETPVPNIVMRQLVATLIQHMAASGDA